MDSIPMSKPLAIPCHTFLHSAVWLTWNSKTRNLLSVWCWKDRFLLRLPLIPLTCPLQALVLEPQGPEGHSSLNWGEWRYSIKDKCFPLCFILYPGPEADCYNRLVSFCKHKCWVSGHFRGLNPSLHVPLPLCTHSAVLNLPTKYRSSSTIHTHENEKQTIKLIKQNKKK